MTGNQASRLGRLRHTWHSPQVAPACTLGELFDVRSTRLMVIRDHWDGLSPHAPIISLYELTRDARGGLGGDGLLSTQVVGEHRVRVTLRPSSAGKFFDSLAAARISRGQYHARIEWTDDLPRIDIALHIGPCDDGGASRVALLFTCSQGRYHTPWGARVGGEEWAIEGEEVGRALMRIRRALKRPMLDRLIREANESGRCGPD